MAACLKLGMLAWKFLVQCHCRFLNTQRHTCLVQHKISCRHHKLYQSLLDHHCLNSYLSTCQLIGKKPNQVDMSFHLLPSCCQFHQSLNRLNLPRHDPPILNNQRSTVPVLHKRSCRHHKLYQSLLDHRCLNSCLSTCQLIGKKPNQSDMSFRLLPSRCRCHQSLNRLDLPCLGPLNPLTLNNRGSTVPGLRKRSCPRSI